MTTSAARRFAPSQVTAEIRRSVVEKTAKIIHANFPQVSAAAEESRKYFAVFATTVSVLGFLALLGINTLLAQDAFVLSNLKVEAKLVADQRDAVIRTIDAHSSPEALASAAAALGMKQSDSPIFLNLASPEAVTRG